MYVLGYLAKDNRVYVCDKEMAVSSYLFPHDFVSYQQLILNGSLEEAHVLSAAFTSELKCKAAVFLQEQV